MSEIENKLAQVGIVVIGRNEGQRLVDCLTSLAPSGCPIVYVDSASTDGSPAAARRLGANVVDLDLSLPFSPGRARNEGYDRLKQSWPELQFAQFMDGDCQIVPGWLEIAVEFIASHAEVAIVCGRRREQHPDASVFNRLCDTEWNTPVGEAPACGGDALVRCAAFEGAGGYDPRLMAGEEPELCSRLRTQGWKIWRLAADMTFHDAAMIRLRQWWMRSVRGGFGSAQVWDTTRHAGGPLYGNDLMRSIFWAAIVPLVGLAAGAIYLPLLLAPFALYGLQVVRLALRMGVGKPHSWERAFFLTLSKFPQLQGMARYAWRKWSGRGAGLIEYKAAGARS